MDNIRLFLFIALAFVVLLIWQAWEEDYGARRVPAQPAATEKVTEKASGEIPALPQTGTTDHEKPEMQVASEPKVHVVTDVLDVEIGARGGDLLRVDLPAYPISVKQPDQPVRLLNNRPPDYFIAQSGVLGVLSGSTAPTHRDRFETTAKEYRLPADKDELQVLLRWDSGDGIEVDKIYTFRRGRYEVKVEHVVRNRTDHEWTGRMYGQLQRTKWVEPGESRFVHTFTGAALHTEQEPYRKVSFDEMAAHEVAEETLGGWAAMLQHYFVTVWAPAGDVRTQVYARALEGGRYLTGVIGPEAKVAAGSDGHLGMSLYLGPKVQTRLEKVAPGLELTVDYGMLWFLSQPLFWLLDHIHSIVGNWGWAIVILTLLIKLAFFHLSATSYRSMANMRRLQPRLAELKERYGEDRQRMSQAMMELYKREKINPLGGCLPIVVQIPAFIALYWVLVESVELRQAPFILWIRDLSIPDPYFVLPLLMGATMLVQQLLNPSPMDPLQKKVMMALPVVFTVFFAFFPAGLVLYWTTNNALSIAQQWHITRRIVQAA